MNYRKMTPRHGAGEPLNVLMLGRISTVHQDIGNLEASYKYAEPVVKGIYDGPANIKRIGEQASGMLVGRKTMLEAAELIDAGWPDVVILEDASKSYRNPRWIYAFVQDCVDRDIRVIAPGDALDTWEENWEVVLGTAALRHGLHIPDTRRRVRRTSAKSFDDGGMVLRMRFSYRRVSKEEAKGGAGGSATKGLRMAKRPEDTPIILELRRRVIEERQGGAMLARWLNEQGVPLGPYAKLWRWTGRLVLDLLRDPILYGLRQFPKVRYEPRSPTASTSAERMITPSNKCMPNWPTSRRLSSRRCRWRSKHSGSRTSVAPEPAASGTPGFGSAAATRSHRCNI
jgi:hypothetical protein